MKETDKLLIKAALVSCVVSFFFYIGFSVIFVFVPMVSDLETVYSVVLRVDAVLFGFEAAFFTFFAKQQVIGSRLLYFVATISFFSYSLSIMSGFAGLLSDQSTFLINPLVPISFTLTGLFTSVSLLIMVAGKQTEERT